MLPVPFMVALLLLPRRWAAQARWFALVPMLLQAAVFAKLIWEPCCPAALTAASDVPLSTEMFLFESRAWFDVSLGEAGRLQAAWMLGLDGLNLLLVGLTLLILPIAVVASWNQTQSPRGYFALILLLEVALLGCFLALDLLLFFLFFELMLVPMYFLIGVWGGEGRRYAAIKFFLYTLIGSVLILLALLALVYSYHDPEATEIAGLTVRSFSYFTLADPGNLLPGTLLTQLDWRLGCFVLLAIGFAIKLPAVPVHTWLPDAHVEASTPISVVLAAVLLKVGGYGMIRLGLGLFPEGVIAYSPWLAGAGVLAILYAGLICLAQKDLKRMIAYSSVAHMGYVLLGIASVTAVGLSGASLQLFAHGLNSALLFLIVGVLYERVHDRRIPSFQGLWARMPRFTAVVMVGFFAGMALPATVPFVAELLVFVGAFQSSQTLGLFSPWMVGAAFGGILLSAGYFIWTFQRMFFGPYQVRGGEAWDEKLTDLSLREGLSLGLLAVLIVLFGLLPQLLLDKVDPAIEAFAHRALLNGQRWFTP